MFYSGVFICSFLHGVLVYNIGSLISQMNLTKNSMANLYLNPGSAGTLGTVLGRLLCGIAFPLGVTVSTDESCDGDGGSLAVPKVNIGGAGTG